MVKKAVLVCVSMLCLTACSSQYSTNDKQQYLASRNGPVLQTPPPLTNANLSGFYDLPPPETGTKVSLAPPQV